MRTTEELREVIAEYQDRFKEPYNAIEEGGNFNGTIYTKKVGNGSKYDLGVYVSGKYYALGRVFKEYVEEVKEAFYLLIAEGFVVEDKNVEAKTEENIDYKNLEPTRKSKITEVGKNAKWINGAWMYPSGNYTEDVLSGYYEE